MPEDKPLKDFTFHKLNETTLGFLGTCKALEKVLSANGINFEVVENHSDAQKAVLPDLVHAGGFITNSADEGKLAELGANIRPATAMDVAGLSLGLLNQIAHPDSR